MSNNVTFHNILSVSYKKIQNKYNSISSKNYKIKEKSHDDENIIELFDDNKKILSGKYEILGIFDSSTNIFMWGDSINPSYKSEYVDVKNIKKKSGKLKQYIINKKFSDVDFIEKLIYYLSNDILYISQDNINDLLTLCTCMSEKIIVMNNTNTNIAKNVNVYYLITDVLSY